MIVYLAGLLVGTILLGNLVHIYEENARDSKTCYSYFTEEGYIWLIFHMIFGILKFTIFWKFGVESILKTLEIERSLRSATVLVLN